MTVFEKAMTRLMERDSKRISLREAMGGKSSLTEAVNAYEKGIVLEALRLSNGEIVKAAQLLGVTYQGLGYILDTRHKDLRHRPKVNRQIAPSSRP